MDNSQNFFNGQNNQIDGGYPIYQYPQQNRNYVHENYYPIQPLNYHQQYFSNPNNLNWTLYDQKITKIQEQLQSLKVQMESSHHFNELFLIYNKMFNEKLDTINKKIDSLNEKNNIDQEKIKHDNKFNNTKQKNNKKQNKNETKKTFDSHNVLGSASLIHNPNTNANNANTNEDNANTNKDNDEYICDDCVNKNDAKAKEKDKEKVKVQTNKKIGTIIKVETFRSGDIFDMFDPMKIMNSIMNSSDSDSNALTEKKQNEEINDYDDNESEDSLSECGSDVVIENLGVDIKSINDLIVLGSLYDKLKADNNKNIESVKKKNVIEILEELGITTKEIEKIVDNNEIELIKKPQQESLVPDKKEHKFSTLYELNGKKYSVNLEILSKLAVPLKKLDSLVGMNTVKNGILDMILYYLQSFESKNRSMLHTVIEGPPGVGKTKIGKIIGEIYVALGVLSSKKFKLVKRTDLIGEYLGHTAIKTKKAVDEANGGVLFIDEAYSLGNDEKRDSFAKECIDTLNQCLSEDRHKFICIIAGYQNELDECFFSYNPGLKRRFPFKYTIEGYKPEELKDIFKRMTYNAKWKLANVIDNKCINVLLQKIDNNSNDNNSNDNNSNDNSSNDNNLNKINANKQTLALILKNLINEARWNLDQAENESFIIKLSKKCIENDLVLEEKEFEIFSNIYKKLIQNARYEVDNIVCSKFILELLKKFGEKLKLSDKHQIKLAEQIVKIAQSTKNKFNINVTEKHFLNFFDKNQDEFSFYDKENKEEFKILFHKIAFNIKVLLDNHIDDKYITTFFEKNKEKFTNFGGDILNLIILCKFCHSRRIVGKHPKFKRTLTKEDIFNGFERYIKNKRIDKYAGLSEAALSMVI
jgi:hypothetical protein